MATQSYEMFTPAGDRACNALVNKVIKHLERQKVSADLKAIALKMLKEGTAKIAEKHPEVYDTEPPEHIVDEINGHFKPKGVHLDLHAYNICG